MNLVDFHAFPPLLRLRAQMGIPAGKTRILATRALPPIGEVEVDVPDLAGATGEAIEYEGRKVVVYIRDQYQKYVLDGGYKFHLAWCEHLEKMRDKGRFSHRYVATDRHDGDFRVNIMVGRDVIERDRFLKLAVCRYCMHALDFGGFGSKPRRERDALVATFDLADYLGTNTPRFEQLPIGTDVTAPIIDYPENWDEVSHAYRESARWICEECGEDYSASRFLLHVHHRNHDKSDCRPSNLQALCLNCHSCHHPRNP